MSSRKRVTFLGRRPDLTSQQFSDHWEYQHGPIAAEFTGLISYLQNHVVLAPADTRAAWGIDGIVELWFGDEAGPTPGRDPSVTARLIADEPLVFARLTGFPVGTCTTYDRYPSKLWILGRWSDGLVDQDWLARFAAELPSACPGVVVLDTHVVDDRETPFVREAIGRFDYPPTLMIILGIHEGTDERTCLADVRDHAQRRCSGKIHPLQVMLAREVAIV